MFVTIVPSAVGGGNHCQFLSTYLVNERVAIDAGCLGLLTPLDAQRRVEYVFLSHAHLDHLATLPLFLDNVFEPGQRCPAVYGSSATLAELRTSVMNDRVWPDFERLSSPQNNFVKMLPLEAGETIQVAGLAVRGVGLKHVLPTLGFFVSDGTTTVAFISDTCDWGEARKFLTEKNLTAVFLECSFPNSLAELAAISQHLTPRRLAELAQELPTNVQIVAVHLKPAQYDQTVEELQSLGLANLQIGEPGRRYEF